MDGFTVPETTTAPETITATTAPETTTVTTAPETTERRLGTLCIL
jgi:hypothetical protein